MKWISVKDRLSKPREQVLLAHKEKGWIHTGYLFVADEWSVYNGQKWYINEARQLYPTHWQKLPKLPKDEI